MYFGPMISPSKNVVSVACSGVRPNVHQQCRSNGGSSERTFDLKVAANKGFRHVNGLYVDLNAVFLAVRLLCTAESAPSTEHGGGMSLDQLGCSSA